MNNPRKLSDAEVREAVAALQTLAQVAYMLGLKRTELNAVPSEIRKLQIQLREYQHIANTDW